MKRSTCRSANLIVICCLYVLTCYGQSSSPSPTPTPDAESNLKIFTEEVVIPVTAYHDRGGLNPALQPEDILLFEDDARQVVRSVRRIPMNVLLLLDSGGELNPEMRVSVTREIAAKLISNLAIEDRIAIMQFGSKLELLQNWTTDKNLAARALKNMIGGKHHQLAAALTAAAVRTKEVPAGTRHIVLITDGVDSAHHSELLIEPVRQLLTSNATVHVIGYGALGRKAIDKKNPLVRVTNKGPKSAKDLADELMYPSHEAEYKKRNKIHLIVDTDFPMRKRKNDYKEATKEAEVWLSALAEETGGLMFVPRSVKEMPGQAEEIAREIDSQYVVSYTPKRPLASAAVEEYRRLNVASGVSGLHVRARRGYVARIP